MWYNFLFVSFYFLTLNKLNLIKEKGNFSFKHLDLDASSEEELLVDLEVLNGKMYARLEQFIKVQPHNNKKWSQ